MASFESHRRERAGLAPIPQRRNRNDRRDERINAICDWLRTLYFGASKAQILATFDHYYPDFEIGSASERRFYRDQRLILHRGDFVKISGKIITKDRAEAIS